MTWRMNSWSFKHPNTNSSCQTHCCRSETWNYIQLKWKFETRPKALPLSWKYLSGKTIKMFFFFFRYLFCPPVSSSHRHQHPEIQTTAQPSSSLPPWNVIVFKLCICFILDFQSVQFLVCILSSVICLQTRVKILYLFSLILGPAPFRF